MGKLLVISSILVVLTISPATGYEGMVGGRTRIPDVKANTEVQDLGRFSVKEFNKHNVEGEELKFSEVVEAEKQVVSGIKYYLKVEAINQNGEMRAFDSVVVVKPWLRYRELLTFHPSTTSPTQFRKYK